MSLTETEMTAPEARSLRVGDVARWQPPPALAGLTLREFMSDVFDRRHTTYPVVEDGRPLGLLHVRDVARHPVSEWGLRSVGASTQRRPGVPVFDSSDDLSVAFAELKAAGAAEALVLNGHKVRVLMLPDVLAAISAQHES